jgi:hypothetical protein
MKNHIGYLESTAFKASLRLRADEKKRFPTKNPLSATFLGLAGERPDEGLTHALAIESANLPDFVVRAVSVISGFAWERNF